MSSIFSIRTTKISCNADVNYILFYIVLTSVSDPDPYQEALIWIRVAPKDYSGKKCIFFKIYNFLLHFARFRNK